MYIYMCIYIYICIYMCIYILGWVDFDFFFQNQAARVILVVKFRADSENHHEKII